MGIVTRFAKNLSWKLDILRGEADQFAAGLQFDLREGLQGSAHGDGHRGPVVDVLEQSAGDRKFACEEHRAGREEVRDECDVEADL